MSEEHIIVDRLDDGYLVTVIDKDGERDAAAETRLAVLDRVFCWLGYTWAERTAMLNAAKKVLVEENEQP